MGTSYTVKYLSDNKSGSKQIQNDIDAVLKDINRKMSTYIADSELSLFNQSKSNNYNISFDTAYVISKALEVSQKSNGAFDITIAPLIDIWGFDKKNIRKVPEESIIKDLLNNTGFDKLQVKLDGNPQLIKKNIDITCNLSAIAKGYAVDKVAELLIEKKINNFLVEIGGEIRVNGKKGKSNWIVGIQSPGKNNDIQISFPLNNLSLATSGDYRNYFVENGKRYSHTINPKTGKPIQHNLASVTVLHESCMMADAYATAINVLGPEKGMEFAKQENLAIFMVIRKDEVFIEKTNKKFKTITKYNKG